MCETVSISIGKWDLFSCKNSFGDLLTIFSKNDLHSESIITDKVNFTHRFLSTTVLKAKQCLDALGYTEKMARISFKFLRDKWLYFYNNFTYPNVITNNVEEELTFEDWSETAKKYALELSTVGDISKRAYELLQSPHSISEEIILYSLSLDSGKFFGITFEKSPWEILRVILDAFPEEQEILLDYQNLFEAGYCDEMPDNELFEVPKTIVLTEGTFDSYVISRTIELLYPHMAKIYSFIDFEKAKVEGSCSYLTHYLKAFIGAKIENRIIALYDNDTAGLAEMKFLESIKIPNNIRIMHLPNLDLCKSYPTIGPSKNEDADINGRACSIEHFLGIDILTENGSLLPIMWTSYNYKLKNYQGVITKKEDIQKQFERKLDDAHKHGISKNDDWNELKLLLNYIFNAFND